jgi:uncharacterized membrane protein YeaQ/YmgE (transglycosylase-associated protein family)
MKNILLGFLAALGAALGSAIIQTFFDNMNGFYVLGSALGAFCLIAVVRPLYLKAYRE